MPLTFSSSGSVEAAPVAFAGYGLQVPAEGKDAEYDSYVHVDGKGKWVVVLRYMPEGLTPAERVRFSRPGALRTKAMIAREKGAVGLIIVSGPTSKVRQQLVPMTFDASLAGSGIAAVSVVDDVVAKWLKAAGKDFQAVQAELDKGQPVQGFEIPDLKIKATIAVTQEKQTGRNVLAKLSADSINKLPAVLLGAHIDHLGMGQGGTSLAAESDGSKIHHGADDNASGVAGVFEIAEWLMEAKRSGQWKPKRDVYFGLWSGEELGILGSNAYVKDLARIEGKNETAKLDGTFVAAFNMDMIGRFSKQLVVQGLGSSPYWKTALEKRNVAVGLPIAAQDDCFLPTDATVFYMRGIPIFNLFTGNHPDYHKPSDTADKLDYPSAAKISTLAGLLMKDIASSEDPIPYVEVKQKVEGQRSGFRIYLGTIPDYAQGNEVGVKLGGVAPGGPAAKAGLQAGDVIIRLAGKELKNIYEYTDVMGVLKVGETIDVTVKRGSEEKTMKITPGSRD
jgi:hypothetical protein